MLRAEHLAVMRQHLLAQLDRLGPAAGDVVGKRQVVHLRERVGVLRAPDLAGKRQHLLAQLERLGPAAGDVVGPCQVSHRRERVGVLRAGGGEVVVPHLLPQGDRLWVETQGVVGLAERGPQLGASRGRDVPVALEVVHRPVEHVGHLDLAPAFFITGFGAGEHVREKLRGRLGVLLRLLGPLTLRGGAHCLPARCRDARQQQHHHRRRHPEGRLVAPSELPELIARARRTRRDRLVLEEATEVLCEGVGRLVAPRPVLLDRFHHDPVEVRLDELVELSFLEFVGLGQGGALGARHRGEPRGGLGRLDLADDAPHLVVTGGDQRPRIEGRLAHQQLVEQHSQRVDVAARVDVHRAERRLLRAHVDGRADELLEAGEQRLVGELTLGRLGDTEVNDLHHRLVGVEGHHHVAGLDVTVDDPLLVSMVDRRAHVAEESEAFPGPQPMLIAELGDGDALDQLHREPRPAGGRRPGVEHLGDVRVVHHRQRLALGLEAGQHFPGVHPGLDDLQRHPAGDRLALLGHPDGAEAALANLL